MTDTAMADRAATAPRALRCRCGLEVCGAGEEHLVERVRAHLADQHPSLGHNYDADDILALSYRKPSSGATA